jgi:hypothetical protein
MSVNWSHLAQDRDQWRALVNTVMSTEDRKFLDHLGDYKFLKKLCAPWS